MQFLFSVFAHLPYHPLFLSFPLSDFIKITQTIFSALSKKNFLLYVRRYQGIKENIASVSFHHAGGANIFEGDFLLYFLLFSFLIKNISTQ